MATAAAQDGSQDDGRDLTGRARIRNAGLHLFAANGFAGTPLRSIAAESWIIDLFDTAIDTADQQSADPVADAAGRDAAVARMLEDHPLVVDYLRRELLDRSEERRVGSGWRRWRAPGDLSSDRLASDSG